jgi:hypothetical protein
MGNLLIAMASLIIAPVNLLIASANVLAHWNAQPAAALQSARSSLHQYKLLVAMEIPAHSNGQTAHFAWPANPLKYATCSCSNR